MIKTVIVGIVVLALATTIALVFDQPPELGLAATIVAFETARRLTRRQDDDGPVQK